MRNHLKLVKVYVKGKRTQLDLDEITFGRVVSSDNSGSGGHLQLIFVETNTIVFGRIYLGSSCLRFK